MFIWFLDGVKSLSVHLEAQVSFAGPPLLKSQLSLEAGKKKEKKRKERKESNSNTAKQKNQRYEKTLKII